MRFEVYTDGSATTAHKPGGWAYVIVIDGQKHSEGSGHIEKGTNNDAELEAAIQGLSEVRGFMFGNDQTIQTFTLVSDSQIVLGWANGTYSFRQTDKIEKYKQLQLLVKLMNVKTRWVEGHTGDEHNERCDTLANAARLQKDINSNKEEKKAQKAQIFMTSEEMEVLEKISHAYSAFSSLEQQHPDDIRDFINGVHIMQGLIMQRICRRINPEKFPSYETTVKCS